MNTFLQVLGVLFLIVLCVGAYYAWKIFRFIKRQTNSDFAKAMSVLPVQELELEPSNSDEWIEKERLAYIESDLKTMGADHVGYYSIYMGMAIIRLSLWSFKAQAVIAIYEATSELEKSKANFLYEAVCKTENGSICVSSNSNAAYDSRPEKHILYVSESTSISRMLKELKTKIPTDKKIIEIIDPKDFFIECYEDIAEWAWRKEQLSSAKTQQVLSSVGVDITDNLMEALIEMGANYTVEVNVDRARRNLAKTSKMSIEEWEKIREELIIINEKMHVHHIIDAIYTLGGELTETQEQVIEGFENTTHELTDPIGAFQMLLQAMNLKTKRIAQMETPVRTEVYLPLTPTS